MKKRFCTFGCRILSVAVSVVFALTAVACSPAEEPNGTGSVVDVAVSDEIRSDSISDRTESDSASDLPTESDLPSDETSDLPTESDRPSSAPSTSDSIGSDTSSSSDSSESSDSPTQPSLPTDSVTGRPLFNGDGTETSAPVLVFDHYENILYLMDVCVEDWDNPSAVIWSWNCKTAAGGKYKKYFSTCVDHRYRKNANGDDLIVTGGHEYACMISYPDGEILWDISAPGANIHSMELLPDGKIALASSNGGEAGGWLRLYGAIGEGCDGSDYVEIAYPGCHGALWDPQNNCLWAIGDSHLISYRVGGTDAAPQLTEIARYTLPWGGGHDLAAVYGDSDLLWCTAGTAWIFRKSTGEFYWEYDGSSLLNAHGGIKGIGNFATSSKVVFVYPNGTHNAYHSDRIYVLEWAHDGTVEMRERISSSYAFYKLRVFDARYQ